jgi:hypothetical protein
LVQLLISVDGWCDGPDPNLDWFVVDDEFVPYVDAMLRSIDGIAVASDSSTTWPNGSS